MAAQECESPIEGLIRGVRSGLVGLYLRSSLTGQLFTVCLGD